MTVRIALGGGGAKVLECDGCQATSAPDSGVNGWAVADDGSGRHACPGCLVEDALFLPAMGLRQWLSWDELEHLFRREPQMDRVRVGRWLTSAERRGQIVRSDDLPPRHRRVDVLPFDSSAPHPAPPPA